jgi:hypothetical protein
MSKSQTIRVTCPSCRQPFTTTIFRIIDAGEDPQLKRQLLSGRVNLAVCPACGMAGLLAVPFAYHDADKQILFVYLPAEAGLSGPDQDKLIGALTQEVMNSLPPERRKAYLLQPQTFLRLDPLFDAILMKDGVDAAALESQKKRMQLINDLLAAAGDDEQLKKLAEEHKAELDYEFYATLTSLAEVTAEDGDQAFASKMLGLRSRLMKLQAPPAGAVSPEAELEVTREELLQRLLDAKDEREFEALTAVGRPLIDYTFYLDLANRIQAAEDAGEADEARKLSDLRERLLTLTQELDQEAQQALQEASDLLRQIYQSSEPEKLIAEHIDELDDLFFLVLTANMDQAAHAETAGGAEILTRLKHIADLAANAVEERMPPRLRLINRLLRAPDDAARQALLAAEPALVDAEFNKTLDALIERFHEEDRDDVAGRLRAIRDLLPKT